MKRFNFLACSLAATIAAASLTGCANDAASSSTDRNTDTVQSSDANDGGNLIESIADILGANESTSGASDTESDNAESNTTSATTAPDASEPETSTPETNVPGNTASVDIFDWPAGVATASPAAPSTPIPEADWAPLPTNEELLKLVTANFENAESFVMTCNIEGGFPDPHSSNFLPSEHNYTLVVTRDATYLKSTFQDLTTDAVPSVYEAFTTYEACEENGKPYGAMQTITKENNEWVCKTVGQTVLGQMVVDHIVKTQNSDMMMEILNTTHLLRFFIPGYEYDENDTIVTAPITRNDDGDIEIIFPEWNGGNIKSADRYFGREPFVGLIKYDGVVHKIDGYGFSNCKDGNVVYTFDNDYRLKTVETDIVISTMYDIHATIEFSNWNNVLPIEVPEYTITEWDEKTWLR